VLDGADVVAGLVAPDPDRLLGDPRGLLREERHRLRSGLHLESVPAGAALDEPEDERERADDP
jgi:hypothetical protein